MKARIWTVVAGAVVLGAARRYYRNWGTTKDECRMRLAGDGLIARPATQTTDAVSIDRCAAEVWPLLLEMAENRADLREGQELAPGDVVRMAPPRCLGQRKEVALTVAEIVPGHAIVLRTKSSDLSWSTAWSFQLLPRGADRCRLLVRTHLALRRPGEVLVIGAAGPLLALMLRAILLNIQRRAEQAGPTGFRPPPVNEKPSSPHPETAGL